MIHASAWQVGGMQYYFGAVGGILLAVACWLLVRRIILLMHGVTTKGRIESFQVSDIDDSRFYLPVVSFQDQEGVVHQFTAIAGYSTKKPPEGTLVTVRYLSSNPRGALIETLLHMWGAPLGFAILGIGGLATLWVT